MGVSASGRSGELRRGYRVAARLGAWTLAGTRLEADCTEINTFDLGQAETVGLVLTMGSQRWKWASVQIQGEPRTGPMVIHVTGRREKG